MLGQEEVVEKTEVCQHEHTEREDYLNACRFAGCNFTTGEHFNCGSQYRLWCIDCGALLSDSADG